MPLCVYYQVPVLVRVEPETGEVISVNVLDEAIGRPLRVTDELDAPVTGAEADAAMTIAESEFWPGWSFGL